MSAFPVSLVRGTKDTPSVFPDSLDHVKTACIGRPCVVLPRVPKHHPNSDLCLSLGYHGTHVGHGWPSSASTELG